MQTINVRQLQCAMEHVCQLIIASEPMLTELDSIIGDGDHGFGMLEGFTDLAAMLKDATFPSVYEMLKASGMQLVRTMGGASGVIFGTMFIGGHQAVEGKEEITAQDILHLFQASTETISRRGRCKAGDKTMLDAMLEANVFMEQKLQESTDVVEVLEAAYEGAKAGVEKTKTMIPRLGRAKNFREQALGYADAGAVSVSIIFRGLKEGLEHIQTV